MTREWALVQVDNASNTVVTGGHDLVWKAGVHHLEAPGVWESRGCEVWGHVSDAQETTRLNRLEA